MLGGVGAGKSTVAARLAGLVQAEVLDADRLAGEALHRAASDGRLVAQFGPEAVDTSGNPARAWLAAHVFGDPSARQALERMIHPPVLEAIEGAVARHRTGTGASLLVLDVPLLLEKGLDRLCDHLLFVDAPLDQRRDQARRRGTGATELARREAAQLPLESKRERADFVISNDKDLDEHLERCLRSLGFVLPHRA